MGRAICRTRKTLIDSNYNAAVEMRFGALEDAMSHDSGASFEIAIDGVPRSYRDDPKIALEAAKYLKMNNPKSEVSLRDLRNDVLTRMDWQPPIIVNLTNGKGR